MTDEAPLTALFDPRSVAVMGASDNPEKWGYWLAKCALSGRGRRTVHLVNRRGGSLDGVPLRPGLSALSDAPEHVVVAVPSPFVRPVVAEGLAAGAPCFTVITPGSGTAEEYALAELVTAGGARLLGPNCLGLVDTTTELRLSWGEFPVGAVGLVSQSGNLALETGRLLARAGQGFSRFVSLGNQRDIDAAEALESLVVAHEPTHVIAAYVEDFRDGRRLARALVAAHAAGKPVLLLTVGRSPASTGAAASHTGALVSPYTTVAAVCREVGTLLLDSAGELVATAVCLLSGAASYKRTGAKLRFAVVGDSGGQGALATDAFAVRGLDVPELSARTADEVAAVLPPGAGDRNPVDLAGARARLSELRHAPLTGWRGAPPSYLEAAAAAVCAVARAAASTPNSPSWRSIRCWCTPGARSPWTPTGSWRGTAIPCGELRRTPGASRVGDVRTHGPDRPRSAMPAIDAQDLIERYIGVWNEPGPEIRRKTVHELWAEDGLHILRPPQEMRERAVGLGFATTVLEARGHDELHARVTRAYEEFVAPGTYVFRIQEAARQLRDVITFRWESFHTEEAQVTGGGLEFLVLGEDGRIKFDYQFVD